MTSITTTDTTSLDNARWRAMSEGMLGELDPFVIAVQTTGIFAGSAVPPGPASRERPVPRHNR
ncbi:MAG: hypothetical protein M3440_13695 [Chloroflexota bacterium]|nr:hypothetical protein [Chloroflexota bacterium]